MDEGLRRIALDPSPDRFARGRAIFQWAKTRYGGNPEYHVEYGIHLVLEQAVYRSSKGDTSSAIDLVRDGLVEMEAGIAMYRARSDDTSRTLLARALHIRSAALEEVSHHGLADAASSQEQRIRDFQETLALPNPASDAKLPIPGEEDMFTAAMSSYKAMARKDLAMTSAR